MSRIKTRESEKDIKVIDKAAVASERMKTALVRSKDQFENLMDDGQVTPSEYAEDKIRYAAEDVAERVGHEVSAETKKAVNKGKEACFPSGMICLSPVFCRSNATSAPSDSTTCPLTQ